MSENAEIKIYEEIDGSRTFIKKVITEHYSHLSDEDKTNFDNIRAYGTVNNPLFNAADVYYCLKKTKKKVERMYDDLLDDEILRQQKVSTQNARINLITEYGIIHACYLYKSDIAIMFQKFMREVIKQLKNTGVATLVEAHKQLAKTLEAERERRQDAERINRENLFLREAYASDFDTTSDEKTELAILRRQHMSVYYLYLVDWAHVNSKYWKSRKDAKPKAAPQPKPAAAAKSPNIIEGIDLHSDDEPAEEKAPPAPRRAAKADITAPHKDGIQEPYDVEFLAISDLENNENDEYYFYISHTESDKEYLRLMTPIYLDKAAHHNKMVDYIINGEKVICRTAYPVNSFPDREIVFPAGDTAATPMSKVYKSTYSKIMSARSRAFIHIHRDELIGAANKKKRQPIA